MDQLQVANPPKNGNNQQMNNSNSQRKLLITTEQGSINGRKIPKPPAQTPKKKQEAPLAELPPRRSVKKENSLHLTNEEQNPQSKPQTKEQQDKGFRHRRFKSIASITPPKTSEDEHVNHLCPKILIKKWVDYSKKYGLGYILSNQTIGVYFNDGSKMQQQNIRQTQITYLEKKNRQHFEHLFDLEDYPEFMKKKCLLFKNFKKYLIKHHQDSFQNPIKTEGDAKQSLVFLKKWMWSDETLLFRLSSNVIQLVFKDGTEVILNTDVQPQSPNEDQIITFIDKDGKTKFTMHLSKALQSPNLKQYDKYLDETKKLLESQGLFKPVMTREKSQPEANQEKVQEVLQVKETKRETQRKNSTTVTPMTPVAVVEKLEESTTKKASQAAAAQDLDQNCWFSPDFQQQMQTQGGVQGFMHRRLNLQNIKSMSQSHENLQLKNGQEQSAYNTERHQKQKAHDLRQRNNLSQQLQQKVIVIADSETPSQKYKMGAKLGSPLVFFDNKNNRVQHPQTTKHKSVKSQINFELKKIDTKLLEQQKISYNKAKHYPNDSNQPPTITRNHQTQSAHDLLRQGRLRNLSKRSKNSSETPEGRGKSKEGLTRGEKNLRHIQRLTQGKQPIQIHRSVSKVQVAEEISKDQQAQANLKPSITLTPLKLELGSTNNKSQASSSPNRM